MSTQNIKDYNIQQLPYRPSLNLWQKIKQIKMNHIWLRQLNLINDFIFASGSSHRAFNFNVLVELLEMNYLSGWKWFVEG